jgi:hypothetical protein
MATPQVEFEQIHANRLLTLGHLLLEVPEARFDLEHWAYEDVDGFRRTNVSVEELTENCNTVGCAVGWATTIPSFRKAGLRLRNGVPIWDGCGGMPECGVKEFFGLTDREEFRLFYSQGYVRNGWNVTPRMVARKIFFLLRARGYKAPYVAFERKEVCV